MLKKLNNLVQLRILLDLLLPHAIQFRVLHVKLIVLLDLPLPHLFDDLFHVIDVLIAPFSVFPGFFSVVIKGPIGGGHFSVILLGVLSVLRCI